MSKELYTYIQKRALKWEKEKNTDESVKIVTNIITDNSLALYKKGTAFTDQEEHLDLVLAIKEEVNAYVLSFCLDQDTEEEIFNALKSAGYDLIEDEDKWFHTCVITVTNEEEVRDILERYLWKHTSGLLY
jgi:phosphoglycolate phosphatase-like HAD superfamily hydrolase